MEADEQRPERTSAESWKALAAELRKARERSGWEIADLAKEIYRSRGHLSNIERGRDHPSREIVEAYDEKFSPPGEKTRLQDLRAQAAEAEEREKREKRRKESGGPVTEPALDKPRTDAPPVQEPPIAEPPVQETGTKGRRWGAKMPVPGAQHTRLRLGAIVAGVFVVGGALVWFWSDRESTDPCGMATELRVLTSDDKEDPIRTLAADYMRDAEDEGCRTVNISVTAAPTSGPVIEALRSDWARDALSGVGPQPDVWLPQSSVEADQVEEGREGRKLRPPSSEGSISSTPLVVASTNRDPGSLRWDDRDELKGLKVVRTNPESSTVGLLATHSLYEHAPDRPEARSAIEGDVITSGDDPRAQLCQLRQAGPRLRQSAVFVPDNVLTDFNNRKPLGGPCARPAPLGHRKLRRVALNPDDPTVLEHPCLVISPRDSADNEDQRRRASKGFCAHLQKEKAQRVLRKHGFEPPSGHSPPVDPRVTLDQWTRARRPARVLLSLDVSGSMRYPLPPTGRKRRIDAAVEAALRALPLVDRSDEELGLWTFPSRIGGRPGPWGELEALSPAKRTQRRQIREALKELQRERPTGGTPLYETIAAGADEVRKKWRKNAINALVVLSDGKNNYDGGSFDEPEKLTDHLDDKDEEQPVRVFIIASLGTSCTNLFKITPAVRGGCFEAATSPELTSTFRTVFASFGRGEGR